MANAGFGLPHEYVATDVSANIRPFSNAANDEPGLVTSRDVPVGTYIEAKLVFSGTKPVSFIAMLGVNQTAKVRVTAFATQADMDANTGGLALTGWVGPMSVNRSSLHAKHFITFPETTQRYFRVEVGHDFGVTAHISFWRFLIGQWVSPADQIEVGPSVKIDDRQVRRYADTGRRNFTNVGIYPAFAGKWPWISATEFKTLIRPMLLKYGASIPVMFVLDYAETTWGEDGVYYGDLEKDQSIELDDGELFQYSFQIVDIAPVVPAP